MNTIPIPEELLEQFERGNALLFIGERIVRDADGQALVDRLSAQLAARSGSAGEGELSFVQASQAVMEQDVQRFHDIFGQQQAALAAEAKEAAEAESEAEAAEEAAEEAAVETDAPAPEPAEPAKGRGKAKAA